MPKEWIHLYPDPSTRIPLKGNFDVIPINIHCGWRFLTFSPVPPFTMSRLIDFFWGISLNKFQSDTQMFEGKKKSELWFYLAICFYFVSRSSRMNHPGFILAAMIYFSNYVLSVDTMSCNYICLLIDHSSRPL